MSNDPYLGIVAVTPANREKMKEESNDEYASPDVYPVQVDQKRIHVPKDDDAKQIVANIEEHIFKKIDEIKAQISFCNSTIEILKNILELI